MPPTAAVYIQSHMLLGRAGPHLVAHPISPPMQASKSCASHHASVCVAVDQPSGMSPNSLLPPAKATPGADFVQAAPAHHCQQPAQGPAVSLACMPCILMLCWSQLYTASTKPTQLPWLPNVVPGVEHDQRLLLRMQCCSVGMQHQVPSDSWLW